MYPYRNCAITDLAKHDAKFAKEPDLIRRERICRYESLRLPACDHPCKPSEQFSRVVHVVREPLTTIASCLTEPSKVRPPPARSPAARAARTRVCSPPPRRTTADTYYDS